MPCFEVVTKEFLILAKYDGFKSQEKTLRLVPSEDGLELHDCEDHLKTLSTEDIVDLKNHLTTYLDTGHF